MKIRDILLLLPGWFCFLGGLEGLSWTLSLGCLHLFWLNPFPSLKSVTQFCFFFIFISLLFYLIFFMYSFISFSRVGYLWFRHCWEAHSDVAKNSVGDLAFNSYSHKSTLWSSHYLDQIRNDDIFRKIHWAAENSAPPQTYTLRLWWDYFNIMGRELKWASLRRQNSRAENDSNFSPVLRSALTFLGGNNSKFGFK